MSTNLIVGYVPGTVKEALMTLAKNNVSGMPILKKDTKNVVGIVTRNDIFRNSDEDQLALIMSKDIHLIEKDADLKNAAKILYHNRIHGLPVVNRRKHLVGIISPTEILRHLIKKSDDICDKYFTKNVVPIYEETPINIVMEITNITHENALPVLNDELKLTGIVTDGDLFKLSHIKEGITQSNMGMGDDEDQWTWEGIRDTVRLYYATQKVDLPPVPVKQVMINKVVKAFKHMKVSEIGDLMLKNNISHVPVADENDRLLGMITDIDLLACII